MVNQLLVSLVNNVLKQTGKPTARGNYSYYCPFCNHKKQKLEINFTENEKGENPWACWVCLAKGKKLSVLFKKIKASPEKFQELKKYVKLSDKEILKEEKPPLELPKEFKSLVSGEGIIYRHAISYLKSRNISQEDIIKYNLGYCEYGPYSNMIIIPSYDEKGNLNYFTARSFEKDPFIKYKNPETSRDIIALDFFINWNLPIILCEGMFDAMAIKRNAIPLLGKNLQKNLLKKIVNSSVQKIYIALDKDAIKQSLKFCEYLMNEGKKIYLVDLNEKDPSSLGFKEFTKLVHNSKPLTFSNLFEKKLQLI